MQQGLGLLHKKRINVFWQFFSSFFIFILIPSIIASLFTYAYVVRLVEVEAEKSSEVVIGHFASRTDEMVDSLQTDLIKLLEYSGLDRFLREQDEQSDSFSRNELLDQVIIQLNSATHDQPLAQNAYLYVVNHDIVIDKNGSFSKNVYFTYINHVINKDKEEIEGLFSGKKMMDFTEPLHIVQKNVYTDRLLSEGRYVSTIISYPFNSNQPKAYLVVNIDSERLREQIAIRHSSAFETAIITKAGQLLVGTNPQELEGEPLLQAFSNGDGIFVTSKGKKWKMVTHYSGSYDWIYLGLTDLEELRRPGTNIQRASAILIFFFLVIGTALSYVISKRMYLPIRDIKNALETGRKSDDRDRTVEGNELDMIKQWSRLLVTEHRDMSALISGMSPVVHEYFLEKVLLGEFRDELSVAYYAKEIGFDANLEGQLAVMCIDIRYARDIAITETDKSFWITDLKRKIEKQLKESVWFTSIRNDLLACVLHLNTQGQSGENSGLIKKAELISLVLREEMPYYRSTIGVGSTVSSVSDLHYSYETALRLLRQKGLEDGVQICFEPIEPDERFSFDGFLSADRVNQMLNLYKAGEHNAILEIVLLLLEAAMRSNASAEEVKQLGVDILNTWLRAAAADNRNDFSIEQYSLLFQRLHGCATWEEMRQFFKEASEALFNQSDNEERPDKFGAVLEYIREHYNADLTSEQLARQMNMSLGHFSRSFKEAVGEKYIEYLTRCRMEAAKELLLQTDMIIDEIAERVGYLSRNSFIKTFRKYEKVTPGKFRDSQRSD
jgi:two-component system response regulator YesN